MRTCQIDGCEQVHFGRGWCYRHYARWWKNGDPGPVEVLVPKRDPVCKLEGCSAKHQAQGLCRKHYYRLLRTGTTDDPFPLHPRLEEGLDRSAGEDGCWLWTGATDALGYGLMTVKGRSERVHRMSYEVHVGPIPDGLSLDHLCRTPLCANPRHLEPVTHRENVLRGVSFAAENATKTHCPQGHPYDEANTRRIPSRPNARYCRTCQRDKGREWAQRKRAAARQSKSAGA